MRFEIFRPHAAQIRAHAGRAFPLECCGLLVGEGSRVSEVVEAANVAADPSRFFEIDPTALFATHRRARHHGLSVLGHYHSHPRGELRPSSHDASQAADTNAIWLIASATALSAWRFEGDSFAPVDLVILP